MSSYLLKILLIQLGHDVQVILEHAHHLSFHPVNLRQSDTTNLGVELVGVVHVLVKLHSCQDGCQEHSMYTSFCQHETGVLLKKTVDVDEGKDKARV